MNRERGRRETFLMKQIGEKFQHRAGWQRSEIRSSHPGLELIPTGLILPRLRGMKALQDVLDYSRGKTWREHRKENPCVKVEVIP